MYISKLIDGYRGQDIDIKNIRVNSKLVEPGDLFICIKGTKVDSHNFIKEAIENGAVFAITSKFMRIPIPYKQVRNTIEYSIELYKRFYGNPQDKLKLYGVTGTDGKTTVTTIIQQLLGNDVCGYIGTNGYSCKNFNNNNHVNTTPAPDEMYRILGEFVNHDCKAAAIEASSEGFYYGRLDGMYFDYGIVTNISSDHLNTHKTLKNYIECKKRILMQSDIQILNSSDQYFKEFSKNANNYYTYGYLPDDNLYIKDYQLRDNMTCINFVIDDVEYFLTTSLLGKFNVENLCAAILTLVADGYDVNDLIIKAKNINIPGRLNFIDKGQNFKCLLDYAHTAYGLKSLFEFVNKINVNRKIVVFGKPGERDKEARYEIGKILEEYNDIVILTQQDARSEDVSSINKDIMKDISLPYKFIEIEDRKQAIKHAMDIAEPNDIVMILGKGIENGLNIKGKIMEHNDLEEINKYLDSMEKQSTEIIKASKIYKNAKVYSISFDNKETRAEAIGIKDDKIIFIGSNTEAEQYIGNDTEIIDCNGGSLLPGFGDAHMHFAGSVRRFESVDLFGLAKNPHTDTPDEIIKIIQDKLKKFADEHPDYPVVHGCGWDKYWFQGQLQNIVRNFTKHDIDAVVNDRPVLLDSNCGHICLLNSKALEIAGVDANTPDPTSGYIRREENNEPDGFVEEPAVLIPIFEKIPNSTFSDESIKQGMLKAQDMFASLGYTYISDCLALPSYYEVLRNMALNDELKMRVDCVFGFNDATSSKDYERAINNKDYYTVKDILKNDTAKYFVDGEFAMCEPYEDVYCDREGLPRGFNAPILWDKDNLMKSMEDIQEAGFNIHIHAMGDYAVKYSIDCLINAKKHDKTNNLRNIIAHCTFVKPEDKKRMGENGIIASIQPKWSFENNSNSTDVVLQVGERRHAHVYPNQSLMDNNVICAYGSDYPVDLPNALNDIQMAMTRKTTRHCNFYEINKDFETDIKEECVTLKEAIKAHTINVAYQFHREDLTGSLELGKSADFVVLDKDIEKTPVDNIIDLQIVETVFKGKTTYKK
ncbi:MAG: UDP-N-acetylmuramyl-tripeptide synthetase [Erysipelotrichaceae bacterium]|nr:UDP-N-acetylmuramyl-tripeptide synthetase [Erysipelotrichaceae bacterium]